MVSDLDIWRATHRLIQRHGEWAAELEASRLADLMLDRPILEEPEAGEIFTLVDADGAFIDIIGKLALHARFEEIFFDPHLSAGQIVGLWESNEVARGAIADLLGADALCSATEPFETAQTARNRECQVTSQEPAPCSVG
jgi:hypothetical protein